MSSRRLSERPGRGRRIGVGNGDTSPSSCRSAPDQQQQQPERRGRWSTRRMESPGQLMSKRAASEMQEEAQTSSRGSFLGRGASEKSEGLQTHQPAPLSSSSSNRWSRVRSSRKGKEEAREREQGALLLPRSSSASTRARRIRCARPRRRGPSRSLGGAEGKASGVEWPSLPSPAAAPAAAPRP